MDHPSLRVRVSGPFLGKLLHERYRNSSSCGGLLYGQVVSGTKHEITDSQHTTSNEDFLCVRDYLPLTSRDFFSSEKQPSKHVAWGQEAKYPLTSCIGVYKIRNSAKNLSLLEKSIHRRLCEKLHTDNAMKVNEHTITLLVTCEANFDATCLSWKINAYVQENSQFSNVKLEVSNLQGSVSDLYISNPNAVGTISSQKTDSVLESFRLSLTENGGGIKVVEASRKVTKDLISELDSVFSRLEESEAVLDKVLKEKSTLLEERDALLEKRESCRHEEIEEEYQAEKRRSLEDIRTRSSVVLLEKLDLPDEQNNSIQDESESLDANGGLDPFAELVSSTKEELKKDLAELDNESIKEQVASETNICVATIHNQ